MFINLVPDFLAVVNAADPVAAHDEYFHAHERILRAYWLNYVVEPRGQHFRDAVRAAVDADRSDLVAMLAETDVVGIAREAEDRCRELMRVDADLDVVLMVGVGAANAGELVVDGRGTAFVCLEHFTGTANHETHGLGLDPELIPLWLAHEMAHVVRYTSPASRSEMKQIIAEAGGFYSYWDTGRDVSLRELLINEGLAVQAARLANPGHAEWEYYGYNRREFVRIRELEGAIARAIEPDLDHSGLGLRLRLLSGGMSESARSLPRMVLPERSGYYIGGRMTEGALLQYGLPWALRASAGEITAAADSAAQIA